MDCCQCGAIENQFDQKKAGKKLDKYRREGPQKTTRVLVEAIIAAGCEDLTLLDIGGGIGAIQHELFKAGIRSAINFEASTAYIEACEEEGERLGHAKKTKHLHGDFTHLDDRVPDADIVTLERVICCYPDMPGLVNPSCEKVGKYLGLVYPLETWWVKLSMDLFYNLRFILTSNPFRVYMHTTEEVDSLVKGHGFKQLFYRVVESWQVVLYERVL